MAGTEPVAENITMSTQTFPHPSLDAFHLGSTEEGSSGAGVKTETAEGVGATGAGWTGSPGQDPHLSFQHQMSLLSLLFLSCSRNDKH